MFKQTLDYDVVVVGGGPSGSMAAIAAARSGAKTLLVESQGYLGGMLTNAGTGPMMSFHAGETQVVKGLPEEMVVRMVKEGFSPGHMKDVVGFCASVTPFDAEGLKIVLETLAIESGVRLLYHSVFTDCSVSGKKIDSIRLFTKGGYLNVTARVFIDASADADLAFKSGIPVSYGRESDSLAQPMTLNAKVYNVDREKMKNYLRENPQETYAKNPEVVDWSCRCGISGAYTLIAKGKLSGDLTYNREAVLCFETNNLGEFIINMTRVAKLSSLNAFDLTEAEIIGRQQVRETIAFLRKYIPGFANCILTSTGPNIGVRESNKINGVYQLQANDLVNNVMFNDAICMGGYPIDIHSPDGKSETKHQFLKAGSWYSVPYRSLVTNEIENLIVAGRCISTDHAAQAATRLSPIVMAIGHAAGVGAALALNNRNDARTINSDQIRDQLLQQGAFLEPYNQNE
jgi:hypothetical protein